MKPPYKSYKPKLRAQPVQVLPKPKNKVWQSLLGTHGKAVQILQKFASRFVKNFAQNFAP